MDSSPSILDIITNGFKQYVNDVKPGGALNPEMGGKKSVMDGYETPRIGFPGYQNTEEPLGPPAVGPVSIDPTDYIGPKSLAAIGKGLFGAIGSGAVFFPGMAGAIKQSGVLGKKQLYPDGVKIVTPIIGSLPESNKYDIAGMFGIDAAGTGTLGKLINGDYFASISPTWLSKTKPYYAIGDNPDELVDTIRKIASSSSRSIESARAGKVPKDVKTALEGEFGKNFSYDVSNAANSNSYYITHKPTGTKIRVSDHDLPSYYENTANLDIRHDDSGNIAEILRNYLGVK